MHFQNLLAAADIGQRHHHLAVKPAGALQGRVEHVRAVGGSNHDHSLIAFKPIHLHQQLVQSLFAFIVAAAQTGTALAAHGIDFVDKDDAGCIFLGLLKHIAHAGSAHAHEHFHKVRAGDAEKRHARFAGNRLGQQGFARTRAAGQQNPARHTTAQALIAVRRLEVIHDFLHFFFRLVATGHIGKGYAVGIFIQQPGTAFAERKRPAFASATVLHTQKVKPSANQQQHWQEAGEENTAPLAGLFFGNISEINVLVLQHRQEFVVHRRIGIELGFVGALAFNHITAQQRTFNIHLGHFAFVYLLDKLRIIDQLFVFPLAQQRLGRGKQHPGQKQPNQNRPHGVTHGNKLLTI